MDDTTTFTALEVTDSLVRKLSELHITVPTDVQRQIIPFIRTGEHLFFQSETGTGKTLAYLLPLIQKLEQTENPNNGIRLIIVAPTYELASQIKTTVQHITDLKTALFIGGTSVKRQIETLKEKPDIVIGNPARLVELIHLKKIKTAGIGTVVLDEADRLISQELRSETDKLVSLLPVQIQLIACSATISEQTSRILATLSPTKNQPNTIRTIILPREEILKKHITHWAIFSDRQNKIDTLRQVLASEKPKKVLVFTSRADQVDNIVAKLSYRKINCTGLYAKAGKMERKAAIDRFRRGDCSVLVTSDLASRGLDITDITHIVQMDLPATDDFFIHRAGRTARAGKMGINIVIGDEFEMRKYAALEKRLGITVYPKQLYNGKIIQPEDTEK